MTATTARCWHRVTPRLNRHFHGTARRPPGRVDGYREPSWRSLAWLIGDAQPGTVLPPPSGAPVTHEPVPHLGLPHLLAALAVAPAHCLLCHHSEREVDPRVGACADVDRQQAPACHKARSHAQAERQGGPASPHRWRHCSRSRSGRSRRRRRGSITVHLQGMTAGSGAIRTPTTPVAATRKKPCIAIFSNL
jgi:hypothetical protein